MGMKKISSDDEKHVVLALRRWPASMRLSWDSLRDSLAVNSNCTLNEIWSRQSLSANESIYLAFVEAKKRLSSARRLQRIKSQSSDEYERAISLLRSELAELKAKYDRLLVRHTQVCYNASLLEGGSALLCEPLPDNTRSQGGK